MKLYENTFHIPVEAIDTNTIKHIPCEGTIIPISIDAIEGFGDQLSQFGHIDPRRNKLAKEVYVYLPNNDNGYTLHDATLCIKCENDNFSIIKFPSFIFESSDIGCINADLLLEGKEGIKFAPVIW